MIVVQGLPLNVVFIIRGFLPVNTLSIRFILLDFRLKVKYTYYFILCKQEMG